LAHRSVEPRPGDVAQRRSWRPAVARRSHWPAGALVRIEALLLHLRRAGLRLRPVAACTAWRPPLPTRRRDAPVVPRDCQLPLV